MGIKPVKMYAISTCVHCNAVRRLLQNNDISFDYIDVDLLPKDERDEFFALTKAHNPKKSFPIVIIGNKAIIGNQRKLIAKELGLSDGS